MYYELLVKDVQVNLAFLHVYGLYYDSMKSYMSMQSYKLLTESLETLLI